MAITLSGGADRPDNLFYDWSTRVAAHDTPDDIVVVAIDDESLAALGPWPWPRSVHAAMLNRLGDIPAAGRHLRCSLPRTIEPAGG